MDSVTPAQHVKEPNWLQDFRLSLPEDRHLYRRGFLTGIFCITMLWMVIFGKEHLHDSEGRMFALVALLSGGAAFALSVELNGYHPHRRLLETLAELEVWKNGRTWTDADLEIAMAHLAREREFWEGVSHRTRAFRQAKWWRRWFWKRIGGGEVKKPEPHFSKANYALGHFIGFLKQRLAREEYERRRDTG